MLDSFSNERLLIYAIAQEAAITLTGGQATYTLGAGGNITTRPMEIVSALIRDGATDYPVDLLSEAEFSAIITKSVQSTYPSSLYDDGGYPQRTITLYPVPSSSKSLILFTKRPLTVLTSIDTVISFPPGYEDALVYNLAIRLAPDYGRPIDPGVAQFAIDAIAKLKISNHKKNLLKVDAGLMPRGGMFNINTGGYGR